MFPATTPPVPPSSTPATVFRKLSIERLSSPDQLDHLLQITSPRGWVALAGITALLVAVLGWGIFGHLDHRVQGQGILLRSGGVLELVAPTAGRVTDVAVQVGDSVHEGQVVGSLAQPELMDQIQQARDQVTATTETFAHTVRFTGSDLLLLRRNVAAQRSNLAVSIKAADDHARSLAERLQTEMQLLQQGLVAKPTVLALREQLEGARERARSYQEDLQRLDIQWLEAGNRRAATLREAEFKEQQAKRELARLEAQLTSSTQVVSSHTGRVLEILTEPGRIMARGEALLTLDRTNTSGHDLIAVIYVPAMLGKSVHPGMQVQIAPSTVRKEEYGMLLGNVTFVSSFPASSKGMQRVLKNDQLIEQLSGGGAPYEVHASLLVDPNTVSGYGWTSRQGPPTRVESGTLAGATIVVGQQMPLSVVLPILNRAKRL